jgi:hypothetical protein
MRLVSPLRALVVFIAIFLVPSPILAQSSPVPPGSVPHLIKIAGVFHPADGQPAGAVETVTLSIYAEPDGGVPLWQETQTIALDAQGHYTVLLGAMQDGGIPAAVFDAGEAQWLGTRFERAGEVEGPRVRLASVPYAFKAQDAETLGGHPASDYALTPSAKDHASTTKGATAKSDAAAPITANVVLPGTLNFLAKYATATDVGPSGVFETGAGAVGIGTQTPSDFFHVRFTNTTGAATGLAVQNLGSTATSYSGMLFFDQNGALGQFQGFNNSSHEYRINNVAKVAPGGAFNGSINFMIGNTSRFFIASNGNVGIGTTSLAVPGLEVSNALTGAAFGRIAASTYGDNTFASAVVGKKVRGTQAAPAPVQNGDQIAVFVGVGQAATHPGVSDGMTVTAAENYTDTAMGARISFSTTQIGTTTPIDRMTIADTGDVGIGTTSPSGGLELSRPAADAFVVATTYKDGITDTQPAFLGRTARGTAGAPTFTFHGDAVGIFGGTGYGTTGFGFVDAAVVGLASENFTDTARGTALVFATTPLGTTSLKFVMGLRSSGFLGIDTPQDADGVPTATDPLQVYGDARVGNAGTNGCLKRFDGTGLVGTCSSDRRLKKDITPFGRMLDKVTALQPVHYFWRASEFPERHFGNSRTYGLVAQDVEQVLPELVATDSDGYKAIDYSKLPLLTIQAVKDLKSENDALKQRVAELEPLARRVAELERLMAEMIAKPK